MINTRLNALCLVTTIFLSLPVFSDSYLGLSFTDLEFIDGYEDTEAISYSDSVIKKVDFTLAAGNDYFVGLSLDLDQEQERTRQVLVKFGFSNWGATIIKGKIKGAYGIDSEHIVQPPSGDFEFPYEGVVLYKRDGLYGRLGLSHSTWTRPTVVELIANLDDRLNPTSSSDFMWVDPEVEYSFSAFSMVMSKLEAITKGYESKKGLGLEADVEIGYLTIETSGYGKSYVNNLTEENVVSDVHSGIASKSTFRWGYFSGEKISQDLGFAFGLGVEGSFFGYLIGGPSAADDYYAVIPPRHSYSWGPFVKVAARF